MFVQTNCLESNSIVLCNMLSHSMSSSKNENCMTFDFLNLTPQGHIHVTYIMEYTQQKFSYHWLSWPSQQHSSTQRQLHTTTYRITYHKDKKTGMCCWQSEKLQMVGLLKLNDWYGHNWPSDVRLTRNCPQSTTSGAWSFSLVSNCCLKTAASNRPRPVTITKKNKSGMKFAVSCISCLIWYLEVHLRHACIVWSQFLNLGWAPLLCS